VHVILLPFPKPLHRFLLAAFGFALLVTKKKQNLEAKNLTKLLQIKFWTLFLLFDCNPEVLKKKKTFSTLITFLTSRLAPAVLWLRGNYQKRILNGLKSGWKLLTKNRQSDKIKKIYNSY
jgi:hypothetical protein